MPDKKTPPQFGFEDFALDYFRRSIIPEHIDEIRRNPAAGLHEAVDDFLSRTSMLRKSGTKDFKTWKEALAV